MATVPISITMVVDKDLWEGSGPVAGYQGLSPLGRVKFDVPLTAIAAKDAANENFIIITGTFPDGFVYRITQMLVTSLGPAISDFDEYETSMSCLITENNVTTHRFPLMNVLEHELGVTASKWNQNSATNDFGTIFAPAAGVMPSNLLINASIGTSSIITRWLNNSSNASAAIDLIAHYEADFWTVEQAVAWPLNESTLTFKN